MIDIFFRALVNLGWIQKTIHSSDIVNKDNVFVLMIPGVLQIPGVSIWCAVHVVLWLRQLMTERGEV